MKVKSLNKRLMAMFLAICLVLTGIAWSPSKKAKAAENVSSITFEDIKGNNESSVFVTSDLELVQSTGEGDVTWTSSDESVIANDGKVTRPAYGSERKSVTLTATVGGSSKNVGVLVAPQGAEEETSLQIDNYNFEEGNESDVTGWALLSGKLAQKGNISIAKDDVYEGNGSMKIATTGEAAEPYSTASLGVRSGYTYTARVMLKGNVSSSVILRFFDMHGDTCGSFMQDSGALNDWQMVSVSAVAPAGAVCVRFSICAWAGATGELYADSVSLYEQPLLSNATFAYGATGWTEIGNMYVSESIAAEAGLEYVLKGQAKADGNMQVKFFGKDGDVMNEQSTSVSSGNTENIRAFASEGTASMKVYVTKDAFSKVELYPAATGTQIADGSFESFAAGNGTAWTSPALEKEVVFNGDFEDGIENWHAYSQNPVQFEHSTTTSYAGDGSLKMSVAGNTAFGGGPTTSAIEAEAGVTYRVTGKYKSNAMTTDNYSRLTLYVRFWREAGYTGTEADTYGIQAVTQYLAVTEGDVWGNIDFKATAPADTKYMTILFYYNGSAGPAGESYFDCLKITRDDEVPDGSFEDDVVNWNVERGEPTYIETTEKSYEGDRSLKMSATGTAGLITSNMVVEAGSKYRLSAAYQVSQNSRVQIYVYFMDENGATLSQRIVWLNQTDTWKSFTVEDDSLIAPIEAKYATILLYFNTTQSAATAYFDCVEWTKVEAEDTAEDSVFEASTEVVTDGSYGVRLKDTYAVSTMIPVIEGKEYEAVVKAKSSVAGGAKMTVTYYNRYTPFDALKTYSVTTTEANKEELLRLTTIAESVDGKSIHAKVTIEVTDGEAYFDGVNMYALSDSVSNASFEDVNDNKKPGTFPTQWRAEGNIAATTVGDTNLSLPNGLLALEVRGIEEGAVYSSMIRATAGNSYTARIMASTQKGGSLQLVFFDKDFSLLSSGEAASFEGEAWKKYTAKATAPDNAAYVALKIVAVAGDCCWVDSADISDSVLDIGSEPQLFIDDYMIANMSGLNRTFHQGEKSEPLSGLGTGLPWVSEGPYLYGSVIYDEDENIYKMWYAAYTTKIEGVNNDANGVVNCYATSKDGINWERPNLGLVEFNGSTDNNIIQAVNKNGVSSNLHIASVMKDYDETDPNKRYKMTTYLHDDRYSVLYSADGLNWSEPQELFLGADVINTAYDDTNDKYFAVLKDTEGYWIRRHYTITSDDFNTWNAPVAANSLNSIGYALDSWGTDSYGQALYERGGAYIGFNWLFMIPGTNRTEGVIDVRLTYSRDLAEEWQIPTFEPIIPLGKEGAIDDGMVFTASSAIEVGDEVWMYCGAWDGDHGISQRKCDAYIAKWRLDGFASLDATDNGQMETKPFTFEGNELRLNADATDGRIFVELVDASGNAIEGFTKDDCTPITGDSVEHAVAWNGSYDVSELEGDEVAIRIYAENSEIYSFQFTDEITVEEGPATDAIHVEELKMSDYQNKAVPQAKEEGYEDWIFAGWYTDETCENAVASTETSGTYFAKFVPAEILSVWCQTLKDTDENSESSKLRLISLVDTLNYEEVGFKLKVGDKELQYKTKSVSSKITAGDVEIPYVPQDFNPIADYFTTVTLTGFTNDKFDDGVRITPYWITLDGTTVEGVARYARIEDSYKNLINVPVRVTSDELVSNGSVEVVYDSSLYEYYPNSDGTYDLGDAFTNMNVTVDGSSLICEGSVKEADTNVGADGLYVNLRFALKSGADIPTEGSTFAVIHESFSKADHTSVSIDVPNVLYKVITVEEQEETTGNVEVAYDSINKASTTWWLFGSSEADTQEIVNLEDEGLEKPADALDAGDKVLKLTDPEGQNWGINTGLYFGDKLNQLSTLNEDDYFLLWVWHNNYWYNGNNWYQVGNVADNGFVPGNADFTTKFNMERTGGSWMTLKFTVKELKAAMSSHNLTGANWLNLQLDTNGTVYIYSLEYHKSLGSAVESQLGYQWNTADTTWGESYCSKSYVTFEEAGISRPSQALDAGNQLLKLTTTEWEARKGIYFSEKLKDLSQYDDSDYFILWMYFESEHWNNEEASFCILGNINSDGKFDADQSGQLYADKTAIAPGLVQDEWIPFKFTVGELKAMLDKQGNTSGNAEWMFINLNFQQNTSVYMYSVEYHKAID